MRECLPSVVRLVEACSKTLVKLSHEVASLGKSHPFRLVRVVLFCEIPTLTPFPNVDGSEDFGRSFDFSKFSNLQEVGLGGRISWRGGGLPWIPIALSTLKSSTSPRLSAIRFDFSCSHGVTRPVEAVIAEVGNDLRRIADEVARIECEFEGTVSFTALLDSVFEKVLDKLNVRFRFVMWTRPHSHPDSFPFVPDRSFGTFVKMGS